MKKICSILMFLIFSFSFSKIDVQVSKNEITQYDRVKLDVIFENEDPIQYDLSDIENNFTILSRGNSRQYQIINGNKTSSVVNSYILEPLKTGKFDLKIKFDNGEVKNVPIEVKGESNLSNTQQQIVTNKSISFNITPLKESYYMGEYIPYTEKLVYFPNEVAPKELINSKIDGFKEKILIPDSNGNREEETTVINGKEAIVLTLYKAILTPISSGEKNIRGLGVRYITDYYGRYSALIPENKIVNILDLPSNAPTGFKNTVGDIKVDYTLNKSETKVGFPVILNIKLFGEGNLKDISNLYPEDIGNATIYQTEKNYDEKIIDNRYYNEKNIEVAILPKENGELKLPEVKIPYFDTKNKKYDFAVIKPLTIKVQGQNIIKANKSPINKIQDKKIEEPKVERVKIENLTIGNEENSSFFKILSIILGILSIFEFIIIICLYRVNINKDRTNERKR